MRQILPLAVCAALVLGTAAALVATQQHKALFGGESTTTASGSFAADQTNIAQRRRSEAALYTSCVGALNRANELRDVQKKNEEAIFFYERANQLLTEKDGPGVALNIKQGMAACYTSLDRFAEANKILQEEVACAKKVSLREYGMSLHSLSGNYSGLRQPKKALEIALQAARIEEKALAVDKQLPDYNYRLRGGCALGWDQVANCYEALQQYKDALPARKRAIQLRTERVDIAPSYKHKIEETMRLMGSYQLLADNLREQHLYKDAQFAMTKWRQLEKLILQARKTWRPGDPEFQDIYDEQLTRSTGHIALARLIEETRGPAAALAEHALAVKLAGMCRPDANRDLALGSAYYYQARNFYLLNDLQSGDASAAACRQHWIAANDKANLPIFGPWLVKQRADAEARIENSKTRQY